MVYILCLAWKLPRADLEAMDRGTGVLGETADRLGKSGWGGAAQKDRTWQGGRSLPGELPGALGGLRRPLFAGRILPLALEEDLLAGRGCSG